MTMTNTMTMSTATATATGAERDAGPVSCEGLGAPVVSSELTSLVLCLIGEGASDGAITAALHASPTWSLARLNMLTAKHTDFPTFASLVTQARAGELPNLPLTGLLGEERAELVMALRRHGCSVWDGEGVLDAFGGTY